MTTIPELSATATLAGADVLEVAITASAGASRRITATNLAAQLAAIMSHSALAGLSADDHPQYHNDTRGDLRYAQLTGATFTGPILVPRIFGNNTFTIANGVELANAVVGIRAGMGGAAVMVLSTPIDVALVGIRGSGGTAVDIVWQGLSTAFSTVKDTPAKFNIYRIGTGNFGFQNLTGVSITGFYMLLG